MITDHSWQVTNVDKKAGKSSMQIRKSKGPQYGSPEELVTVLGLGQIWSSPFNSCLHNQSCNSSIIICINQFMYSW